MKLRPILILLAGMVLPIGLILVHVAAADPLILSRVSTDSAGNQVGALNEDPSFEPVISADGRYVAFASNAPDLVPGDTNGATDILATPTFPGKRGGPVTVRTFYDSGCIFPENSLVSQRSIWGPSFEEVQGTGNTSLADTYHWTWYDQFSAGVTNWVLIANRRTRPALSTTSSKLAQ